MPWFLLRRTVVHLLACMTKTQSQLPEYRAALKSSLRHAILNIKTTQADADQGDPGKAKKKPRAAILQRRG